MSDSFKIPIKVRGKRHGLPAEKIIKHQRRDAVLRQPRLRGEQSTSPAACENASTRWRRCEHTSSAPLENLPAEIMQMIFEFSLNLNLPLTSKAINLSLSKSRHVHNNLIDAMLAPVLNGRDATMVELKTAQRLLAARFMTWDCFSTWLQKRTCVDRHELIQDGTAEIHASKWLRLHPSDHLVPPSKLMTAPFTEDKVKFLRVLSANAPYAFPGSVMFGQRSADVSKGSFPGYAFGEVVAQGLAQAVREGNMVVASLLLKWGPYSDTNLLRLALGSRNVQREMVNLIVSASEDQRVFSPHGERDVAPIDYLDQELWALANKLDAQGEEWAKQILYDAVRRGEDDRLPLARDIF